MISKLNICKAGEVLGFEWNGKAIATKKADLAAEIQKVDYLKENFAENVNESVFNKLSSVHMQQTGLSCVMQQNGH